MQREQATIAKDNSAYSTLERRYETVMKEVRGLEGELADHNLALDKMRTHSSVDELQSAHRRLQLHNADMRGQADEIFLSCGQQEARKAEVQNAMDALEAEALQAVRVLGEDKLTEFEQLQEERNIWRQRRQKKMDRIKEMQAQIQKHNSHQQSHDYRRKQQVTTARAQPDTRSRNAGR
jgi:intraflagellar transport protein 74